MSTDKNLVLEYGARLLSSTARRFGSTFERRRGFLIKVAQFLAFENEAIESELGRFFYDLKPMSVGRARTVITESLGRDPLEIFERFDPDPMAAASIAQVHRARIADDRAVVVKVQYPTVAQALEADIRMLGQVVGYLPHAKMNAELIEEMRIRMLDEVDFEGEAQRMTWFRTHLAVEGVSVPAVHPTLCGPRVLTMDEAPGLHMGPWHADDPSQEIRNAVGNRLARQFWDSLLVLQRVHADLHPGNVLLTPAGDVSLIDFGSVKDIESRLAGAASNLVLSTLRNRRQDAYEAALQGGLLGDIDEQEGRQIFDSAIVPFLDWLVEPLRSAKHDFSKSRGQAREGRRRFVQIIKANPRPGVYRPLLFLNRTVYLLYSMLERIGGTVPMRAVFESAADTHHRRDAAPC